MRKVVIVSAARTPIGDFGGSLKSVKPVDLFIAAMRESIKRAGIDGESLDQVVCGNCFAPIEQNIARISLLLMGLPYNIHAFKVDCSCASAAHAVVLGHNAIAMGQADVVLAGGVESMSNAPYILSTARWGQRLQHGKMEDLIWTGMQEYPVGGGVGLAAERLAEKYGISREEQDRLAVSSHQRAVAAIKEGKFTREIVPVQVSAGKGRTMEVAVDEHPRQNTSMEQLGRLPAAFKEGGSVTAGNASSLNDGAAAVILMSAEKAAELGMRPMATIRACSSVAVDPFFVGIAPVPAIKKILDMTRLSLEDIELFEINEAFASYYLATEKELGLRREITNVNGSGISLGHPVGCTGCRLLVTLIHEMERRGLSLGISSLCAGGGVGSGILLERE
jgi:acetyl-CoA C-acetyltransferase